MTATPIKSFGPVADELDRRPANSVISKLAHERDELLAQVRELTAELENLRLQLGGPQDAHVLGVQNVT